MIKIESVKSGGSRVRFLDVAEQIVGKTTSHSARKGQNDEVKSFTFSFDATNGRRFYITMSPEDFDSISISFESLKKPHSLARPK